LKNYKENFVQTLLNNSKIIKDYYNHLKETFIKIFLLDHNKYQFNFWYNWLIKLELYDVITVKSIKYNYLSELTTLDIIFFK
jgi:hypothetical protein